MNPPLPQSPASDPMPPFRAIGDLLREHARAQPDRVAVRCGADELRYGELDALVDRVATSLQRDGLASGEAIAICAQASVRYLAVFLGALRAGVAVAPLAPSSTPRALAAMARDAQARLFFGDELAREAIPELDPGLRRVGLDEHFAGERFDAWVAAAGTVPRPVAIASDAPFNIIYSSGTTGVPKGIVQSHGMRWAHIARSAAYGYGPDAVALLATPLYSNTTLVVLFPALAAGARVVLSGKFDAEGYLALAARERMTHTMLVPVQYQRIMDCPRFGQYDLSATRCKFCTSAPFSAALKAQVLQRWPGGLVEFYGMTEGGGTCILAAHEHPDKLHTVGRPAPGHDIRLIDEAGREVPRGATGEVVGRSPAMMTGYHGRPDLTHAAEWHDALGQRFIRTGDLGRFDEDGFLVLLDRKKDMLISGGFNIYPSDLEAVLATHPAVLEVAVVGVPSARWGETPVACVVLRPGQAVAADELLRWTNEQVGRTQRLAQLHLVGELPRSAIGKVLKRELRERLLAQGEALP